MNIRQWLIGPAITVALLVAAPVILASGDLIISGPSLFMHNYAPDSAHRNRSVQRGFKSPLDGGHALGQRRFDARPDRHFRRSQSYQYQSDIHYRYRSQPAFGFNFR